MKTVEGFSILLLLGLLMSSCSVPQANASSLASSSLEPSAPGDVNVHATEVPSLQAVKAFQTLTSAPVTATMAPSSTQTPTGIMSPAETLRTFLTDLADGAHDPSLYQQAANLFSGSLKRIKDYHPQADQAPANLLKIACEDEGYRCLPVRQISLPEKLSAARYRLWVQFNLPDGSLYKLPAQPTGWVDFIVASEGGGQLVVMDLPTLYFGYRDTFDPVDTMTSTEVNGLDELGILRALWLDWLSRYCSANLEDRIRLSDFVVNQVTQDASLSDVIYRSGLTSAGMVNFSIKPVNMLDSDWQSSGGDVAGDWIQNREVIIGYRHEGALYRLEVIDANP